MSLRLYISPIVGDGLSKATTFRAKLGNLVAGCASFIPTDPNTGAPLFAWGICVARQTDWTAVDADATLESLYGVDLPDTAQTFADLKAFLQSKVVGDIPAARRQALNTRLTNHGLDTSQITLQTTWWQVLVGIYKFLNGGTAIAGDGGAV